MKVLVIICVFLNGLIIMADYDSIVTISRGNGYFASDLYKIISKNPGNVFFSPISAHAILSLLYQGAAGRTAEALENVLNIPSPRLTAIGYKHIMSTLNSARNVKLHIANKIFVHQNYKLRNYFKCIATKYFQSEVENLDFNNNAVSVSKINYWVDRKTESKIKNIIKPADLSSLTHLVLVNAIYFKSDWAYKFQRKATRKEEFWVSANCYVHSQMMHITERFNYAESVELDAKILQIPYSNRDLNMVIILPNAREGVDCLEAKLANVDLTALTRRTKNLEVDLSLPKFKFETEILLNEPLKKLGLGQIFKSAQFPNMLESPKHLEVSKVIQKAFINVDEEGTEAAAATAVTMEEEDALVMPKQPSQPFKVDHPFIFMVQYSLQSEQLILFMGKVTRVKE